MSLACSCHYNVLDTYAEHIVHTLHDCALHCIPSHTTPSRRLVGWKAGAGVFKEASNFWHKVWVEAGCPSSGVLFSIKKNAKRRYKYAHRRLKRRQQYMLQKKLACPFSQKTKENNFWSDIKLLHRSSRSSKSHAVPIVDGVSRGDEIANVFALTLKGILNTHSSISRDSLLSSIQSSLTGSHLSSVDFSKDDVLVALKNKKSDSSGISTEHLKHSSSAIAESLALLFTSILRHGYMPKCFRDCVLVPIQKGSNDATLSQNYRPINIALASSLSKVLERLIISKYETFFHSNALQFGFKRGHSTSLCTATVKNVVSHYMHNGSAVLGCFLDASIIL